MTTKRDRKLPMLMVLQRKSIRLYPNNISVGLYYSKDLDQYFAISTEDQSINMTEDVEEEIQ